MITIVRAELFRLVRRRTAVIGGLSALAFALVAAFAIFASATRSGSRSMQVGTSLERLAASGGGTEAFAVGASFAALLAFVTAIAIFGGEFTTGTFRSWTLRDPHRIRVIVGKFVGLLGVLAGILVVAEALTFGASLLAARWQDVPTSAWFSGDALRHAAQDLGTVFAGLFGWMVFGAVLAVVLRSVPVALAVGVAWSGPFENITVDSWTTGYRVFPGQVLRSVINGGTAELGFGTAVVRSALYVAVAVAVALTVVHRRDITS
jgi:ABC-type transport system involved in multi-copper enzyme maturation permease subunit